MSDTPTTDLDDGMRKWLATVVDARAEIEAERSDHQEKAKALTTELAELSAKERRYKIALGMSPARPQRKPAPAASEATPASGSVTTDGDAKTEVRQ